MDWIWLPAGLLAGGAIAWMLAAARGRAAAAAAEARASEMQRAFETAERRLIDSFKALASDALKANTDGFLSLAHERLDRIQKEAEQRLQAGGREIANLVGPVRESLGRVDEHIRAIETARQSAYDHLTIEVGKLQAETVNLVTALRKPDVRGRWGEIQLKRVVEFAGMLDRCDFQEQASVTGEDG